MGAYHLSFGGFVFFINVPIGIIALLWGGRVIPPGERKPDQQLDIPGAVLAFFLLFSRLLHTNRGERLGWFSGWGLGMLVCILAFGWLFIRRERKASQPMLNLKIFANRRFTFACVSSPAD